MNDGQRRVIADWSSPGMISSPVSFCLDQFGNVYIAESQRAGNAVQDTRNIPHLNAVEEDLQFKSVDDRLAQINKWLKRGDFPPDYFTKTHDSIRLVRDTDGDGVGDTQSVFADGFNEPLDGIGSGLMWVNGSLYYTCIPHLWKLTPGNDPLVAQKREQLSTGYGVRWCFYGHDLHGLVQGPDGRIYFSMGDRGYSITTKEGKHFDGVDRGGIFRCWPDGSELELIYQGLRNPQELAFDEQGELFTGDNNCDSGDKARIVHIVEGGDSGWRQNVQSLDDRGPWNREFMWKTLKDVPAGPSRPAWSLPPVEYMCAGPSGIALYPGTGEDRRYDGHLFLVDFYGSGAKIHSFLCTPQGAGFQIEDHTEFYKGLTVTDIAFGYDGRLYASDWGGGWSPNPNGKMFTITNTTVRESQAEVAAIAQVKQVFEEGFAKRSNEQLLSFLSHRDYRVRLQSQLELASRGEANISALSQMASGNSTPAKTRLHAIWGLGHISRTTPSAIKSLIPLLQDPDAEIRAQAARTLGDLKASEVAPRCVELLADPSPRARLYAAQALGRIGYKPAIPALLNLLNQTGSSDTTLRHGASHALANINDMDAAVRSLLSMQGDSAAARLGLVIAMRELKHPRIGAFLADADAAVIVEAARAVYDHRIAEHLPMLASLLERPLPEDAKIEPLLRRIIEANVHLGDQASSVRLAHIASDPHLGKEWRNLAADRLLHWDEPLKREGIWGDWENYSPRDSKDLSKTLPTMIPAILAAAAGDKDLLPKGQALEARYLLSSQQVLSRLASPETAASQKTVLLQDLAIRKSDMLASACKAVLEAPSTDGELRSRAEELWANSDPASAAIYLANAAMTGTLAERQHSIEMLGRIDAPPALTALNDFVTRLERGTLDPAIALDVYEAAQARLPDGPKKDALRILSQQGTRPTGFATAFLKSGGDPVRGKQIFQHNAQAECLRCHTVDGMGGNAGPNLSGVALRLSVEKLVESIVEPGATIAPGFGTITAMPEMTRYLKPGQVRDVVAFLSTLNTPPVKSSIPAATSHAPEHAADSKSSNTPLRFAFIAVIIGVGLTVWRSLSRKP